MRRGLPLRRRTWMPECDGACIGSLSTCALTGVGFATCWLAPAASAVAGFAALLAPLRPACALRAGACRLLRGRVRTRLAVCGNACACHLAAVRVARCNVGFGGLRGRFGLKRGGLGGLGFGNGLRCGCLCRRDGLDAHFGLAHLGAMPLGHELETRLRAALRFGFGRMCAALLGFLDQRVLRIEQRLAGFGQRAELRVAAVGQKLAQLGGVAQARVEVLAAPARAARRQE